ncbi:hypothetical protein [Notoacmeibacter ruber]|nr:hypothetical protein [Notoacmeibacter ruber]
MQADSATRMEGVYRSSDDYWWSGWIIGANGEVYRFQHSDIDANETAYSVGEGVTFRPDGRFAREIRRSGDRIAPFRTDVEEEIARQETYPTEGDHPAPTASASEPRQYRTITVGWWAWPLAFGIMAGFVYLYLLGWRLS